VTNESDGTVSVISTATNTVAATVTVGVNPKGVAFTPNGSYAYVTNYTSGTVSVIAVSPIVQVAPFAAPVAAGSAYSGQLAVTGNTGAVAYTTTVTSLNVAVSSSGRSPPQHHPGGLLHGVGHRCRSVGRQRHVDVHLDRGRGPHGDRGGPKAGVGGGGRRSR